MAFQTTVYLQQGFSVAGELFNSSPTRVEPFIINSSDPTTNVFGRAFTLVSEGVAQAGGTGIYVGILVNPKNTALTGTSGNPLAPTLTISNYSQGQILSMGTIVISLGATANIGDLVVFDNVTGVLSTIAPGAGLPSGKTFANAVVDYYQVTAAGLAVITVSPSLVRPT